MKKLKKVLAMMLSLAMVIGMSVTAFAGSGEDGVVGTSDDTGTITVGGITDSGVTVKAYPIVTATYDDNNNFSGYANPYNISDMEKPTESELAAIAGNLPTTSYTLNGPDEAGNYTNGKVGENPEVPLGIGMYLIMVEGAESSVYNPAVASINYKNQDGSNVIDPGSLTMGTTIDENNTWVKKSGQPGLDKTVRDDSTGEAGEGKAELAGNKGNTVNIGDNVIYDVKIDPIPNYGGNYPVLNIRDTLSNGLTYVESSIKVFTVGKEGTYSEPLTGKTQAEYDALEDADKETVDYIYAASPSSQVITVNFVVGGKYMLNNVAGQKAVIEYKATVNDQAAVNSAGNKNDVTLTYSKNSNIDGDEGTEDKETHTYTFDIDGEVGGLDSTVFTKNIINKLGDITDTIEVEGETKRAPLKNAVFGLFTDSDATQYYTNKSGENGTEVTWNSITTDEEGQTYIKGLKEGTYYLKETAAPAGYSVNTHIFTIVIDADIDSATGLLKMWKVTIDGKNAATFNIDNVNKTVEKVLLPAEKEDEPDGFNIQNTKLSELPSTGGIGTTIFTIGGCVIMIIAAGLFFASRRKKAEN